MPNFGKRITGEEEYVKAVREEKAGAGVFGVRVRSAIPETPGHIAARATEHGPRVAVGAHQTNTEGDSGDMSVKEIANLLRANHTYLPDVYEAELGREGGPRRPVLEIIRYTESQTENRPHIMEELDAMLRGDTQAERRAEVAQAHFDRLKGMQERAEENTQLRGAERIKAMREREEDLKAVRKLQREREKSDGGEGELHELTGGGLTTDKRTADAERTIQTGGQKEQTEQPSGTVAAVGATSGDTDRDEKGGEGVNSAPPIQTEAGRKATETDDNEGAAKGGEEKGDQPPPSGDDASSRTQSPASPAKSASPRKNASR